MYSNWNFTLVCKFRSCNKLKANLRLGWVKKILHFGRNKMWWTKKKKKNLTVLLRPHLLFPLPKGTFSLHRLESPYFYKVDFLPLRLSFREYCGSAKTKRNMRSDPRYTWIDSVGDESNYTVYGNSLKKSHFI